MINAATPIAAGTAINVLFAPATGTKEVRILRKLADDFTGQDDPDAFVVYDGLGRTNVIDFTQLVNGQTYYYREYDFDGTTWTDSPSVSAVPAPSYTDAGQDVLLFIRARLEDGLRAVVTAGTLKHDNGYIPVFSAPPLFENVKWPAVSVHLRSDSPEVRALGEDVFGGEFNPQTGTFVSGDGWLARKVLDVVGWSLNPDERIALRRAIKAVMLANLPVFDSAGLDLVEFSQSDSEDFETYSAPMYRTDGTFSCLAPELVTYPDGSPITGVTVSADAEEFEGE